MAEVAKRSGELDGQEIKVIGLLDANHDGSSLRDFENDKTFVLVPYFGVDDIVSANGWSIGVNQFVRWQDKPVVVHGKYVIRSFTHMGLTTEHVPMIMADRIEMISFKELRSWSQSKHRMESND